MQNQLFARPSKTFIYRKAFAQPESGGKTWRVVTGTVKHRDGHVEASTYEAALPSKFRAVSLAKVLNSCAK
jgi:hypothetical protein